MRKLIEDNFPLGKYFLRIINFYSILTFFEIRFCSERYLSSQIIGEKELVVQSLYTKKEG